MGVSLLLCGYACYFLQMELVQLLDQRLEYFYSVWNYLDIIPPITITVMVGLFYFSDYRHSSEPTLMSISAIIMWMKMLNFFRLHEETGYLIRMLI